MVDSVCAMGSGLGNLLGDPTCGGICDSDVHLLRVDNTDRSMLGVAQPERANQNLIALSRSHEHLNSFPVTYHQSLLAT